MINTSNTLSAHFVPGSVPSALYGLSHLIYNEVYLFLSCFIEKEVEVICANELM